MNKVQFFLSNLEDELYNVHDGRREDEIRDSSQDKISEVVNKNNEKKNKIRELEAKINDLKNKVR